MTKFFVGHVWHAGRGRQVPSTFRSRNRLWRARIFWRADNTVQEQLCEHEHPTEVEAFECAQAMAKEANGPAMVR